MLLGYNTNGFVHHRLDDALEILAELGYQSVAITIDHHALNPFAADFEKELLRIRDVLANVRLRSVIETGARFLLDPRKKHSPTLLSKSAEARRKRFDFLKTAIEIAHQLKSDAVSFWSGKLEPDVDVQSAYAYLIDQCMELADFAQSKDVRLAFEPEPGMLIDTMESFARLHRAVNHPAFGLTMDLGHLHCLGDVPIAEHIVRWNDRLWNIHIEDMRKGVHDHLMFGEGEIDFVPVFRALRAIDYIGPVHVELSRHSHDAVNTAQRAMAFLQRSVKAAEASGQ